MATAQADLLTPTLSSHRPRDWAGRLPWRVSSQVYPAILGGPISATLAAVINARRLRMPPKAIWTMVAVGLLTTAAAVGASLASDADAVRLLISVAGLAAYGVFYLLQRSPDRVHSTFSPHEDPDEDYESFLAAGIAAIVVGWLALGVLFVAVGAV